MKEKICIRCGKSQPEDLFNFKKKSTQRRNAQCKNCTRSATKQSYDNNHGYYLERAKLQRTARKKAAKLFMRSYLKLHACVDCGIKDPIVLEFDHVIGVKRLDLSTMVSGGYSLGPIKAEIAKCVIRCANCHLRKTAKERGYYLTK